MTKINLGNNGPLVSKLGLGCMRMSPVWGGPANDERESIATIQMALDNGINFLNTKLARVCGIDKVRGVLVRWQNEITNDRRKYHLLRSPRWTTEYPA